MALVNPQIAMSYRPTVEYQPRNALAEYAQIQQIMGGQRQAEVADMQMEAFRRKEKAISQIQAAAVKNGGPSDRREIARAYINSGVPEFMQFGLTMDKELDELDAFSRIMGGGAGGAARAAPSVAAAASGATAPKATPTFPIAGKDVRMGTLGTGTFDSARSGDIGLVQPGLSRMSAADRAELAASAGPGGIQSTQMPQGPYTGTESIIADILRAPPEEQAAIERALPSMKIPGVSAGQMPPFSQLSRDLLSPETRNALSYGYAPTSLTAPAESVNALAPPPENVNQLASAGAAPAGAASAGAAQPNSVAALRARRDQLIALGTPRALQAAKSLDADIALLSRTTAVAPGSTVIGPDGKEVYRAGAAPSSIATLEAEIAALKKAGATEDSLQVQSRRAAIQQASGQSTDLIRNYNAAVADGFKGTIFEYQRQIAAAGRAPVQPVAPTVTTVEDPTKPGSFLQVDARTYRGGGAGSPGVIGGARPSATAEKTAAQRAQMGKDLDFAISELSNITKDGGLIDQSTGSGAGRLVDIGAGFVGQATKGAIAIGKIEPVADLALKMVPRFEGPQSNMDTASYKAAAGQLADPTLPTAIRKEAGKTVLRLMRERKNQFITRDMAAEGAATGAASAGGGAAGGGVDTSNPLLR